jgi:arylsulfatase
MNRPHVLLITADHWPASLLGCAGHPDVQTPTLDELARCGTRFTNAYSECPVCIPARRTLLTGMAPRSHGDRTFQTTLPMPDACTIAETFRNAGYQTFAAGKLHVYPQRARVGFDDVLLAEEGRPHWGVWDDYDIFLGDRGYAGRQFDHGMSNNQYSARPWHLPEDCHVTNWTAQSLARIIRRRDPTRPGFWYLSFTHPHPPLVPPRHYWDLYQRITPREPQYGDWVPESWRPEGGASPNEDDASLPFCIRNVHHRWHVRRPEEIATALRAFYALCTHIDHQIRVVLGTLREEGILDETTILFTSDHGDMLGRHGLWAKRLYYEPSANVPMILVPPREDLVASGAPTQKNGGEAGRVDDRLAGLQDVMPTLLDLAGLPIPQTCDGVSLVGPNIREHFYGECNEGPTATRMIHDGRYKLIYYPSGNCMQLFDLATDPDELHDLAPLETHRSVRERLEQLLIDELYGSDQSWLDEEGRLIGIPDDPPVAGHDRGLFLQRGTHWPPPPVTPPE